MLKVKLFEKQSNQILVLYSMMRTYQLKYNLASVFISLVLTSFSLFLLYADIKMYQYFLSFIEESWHFGLHLLIDGVVCYFLEHRNRSYVSECFVFSFLSICASSCNLVWLKLLLCFLLGLFLRNNQLKYGRFNLIHELIHLSVTCGLHLWMSIYDSYIFNFWIGVFFFILHLVWENDDYEEQLFRYFIIIGNFIHLFVWLVFGQTVMCFMFPGSESC